MPDVADIGKAIEAWAPRATAQSYDNVGLQVGRADVPVERVLVALDLVPEVIDEAIEIGANLIITHHPLLFRPLQSLTPETQVGALALRLAEKGIALYAAHTNLDAAHSGVSFALAESLGLRDVKFLSRLEDSVLKLVTFVPLSHEEVVRVAMAEARAGRIGNYDSCSFGVQGVGRFRAGEGADPAVGDADGRVQSVDEVRLEVEVPRWMVAQVVAAMKNAHPYEEVAYDLYPVVQPFTGAGLGAIGSLPVAMPADDFLAHVAGALGVPALRYSGAGDSQVSRVAVCGGAGSDLIPAARAARADAYVTSDVSYHRFFDVMDESRPNMLLVDAGHYETEAAAEALIARFLTDSFPTIDVHRTRVRTGPVRYHVR